MDAVEKVYRYMEFPGCVGLIDVTNLHWVACPKNLKNRCVGRFGTLLLPLTLSDLRTAFITYLTLLTGLPTILPLLINNGNYPRRLFL